MKKVLTLSLGLLFMTGVSFANLDGKGAQKEGAKKECCSKEAKGDKKSCGEKEVAAKGESCAKSEKKGDCCSKESSKKSRKATKAAKS